MRASSGSRGKGRVYAAGFFLFLIITGEVYAAAGRYASPEQKTTFMNSASSFERSAAPEPSLASRSTALVVARPPQPRTWSLPTSPAFLQTGFLGMAIPSLDAPIPSCGIQVCAKMVRANQVFGLSMPKFGKEWKMDPSPPHGGILRLIMGKKSPFDYAIDIKAKCASIVGDSADGEDCKKVCDGTVLAMVEAYDGEGKKLPKAMM